MILFLDTDILIDLATDREPFSLYAASLFDKIQKDKIKTFIAWHTVSNFYYLVRSHLNDALVKEFIVNLLEFVKISKVANDELKLALKLKIKDFEDAMQTVSALAVRADFILTRNVKDFKNSPIRAINPKDFLSKYSK